MEDDLPVRNEEYGDNSEDANNTGLGLNDRSMSTDGGEREQDRRGFMKGLGLGALGTGIIGSLGFGAGVYTADHFYDGGDAYNSTDQGGPGFSNGDSSNSENDTNQTEPSGTQDNGTDVNDTDSNDTNTPEPPENDSTTEPPEDTGSQDEQGGTPGNETDTPDETPGDEDNVTGIPEYSGDTSYEIDGEVEVDLDSLDSVYEGSSVIMAVQDDGDLIAWNTEVENEDGYNPLWRFSQEDFPNREFYDVSDHPVEEIYQALEADVESLSESMVRVFYDGDDWESESEYKEIEFEDLKNGLLEYSDSGQAQDYFFNRSATLNEEEPVLEPEWQELLQDGL